MNAAGNLALGPVFPITILSAVGTFCYAAYVTRRGGPLSLGNGFLGFIAGAMLFELPFVLIIIPLNARALNIPPISLIISLVPIFIIGITTLSLLLLSRRIALTTNAVYMFAAMMFVWGLWALDGFSSPTTLLSFALNGISKVLAFACIGAMFLPKSSTDVGVTQEKSNESVVNHATSGHQHFHLSRF